MTTTTTDLAKPDDVSYATIDDEFVRTKKYTNDCNFSDEVLRRRELEMKDLRKLYPNVPPAWLELSWNYCEFTPQEEQDNVVKNKLWEEKPTKRRATGGTLYNSMNIVTANEIDKKELL